MYDFYDFYATIGHISPINKGYLAKTTLNPSFFRVWFMTFLSKSYVLLLTMTNLIINKYIKVIVIKGKTTPNQALFPLSSKTLKYNLNTIFSLRLKEK